MDLEDGFEYRNTQRSTMTEQPHHQYMTTSPAMGYYPAQPSYSAAHYMTSTAATATTTAAAGNHESHGHDFARLPTDNSPLPEFNRQSSYGMSSSPTSPATPAAADSSHTTTRSVSRHNSTPPAARDNRSAIRRFFAAYKTKNQVSTVTLCTFPSTKPWSALRSAQPLISVAALLPFSSSSSL